MFNLEKPTRTLAALSNCFLCPWRPLRVVAVWKPFMWPSCLRVVSVGKQSALPDQCTSSPPHASTTMQISSDAPRHLNTPRRYGAIMVAHCDTNGFI
jgi:hypothetical protein